MVTHSAQQRSYCYSMSIPPWEGAIMRGKGASHCKVRGYSVATYTKTTEPIEMPFGLRAWMELRNHLLDGGSDPPCEGAILGK